MPNNITNINDYVGYTLLVDKTDYFNEFAFQVEKNILRGDGRLNYGLLGDEIYLDLISDLDSDNKPQTQKYIDLINGKTYVQTDGRNTVFCGIKTMLTYFVYSEYIKNNISVQSGVGSVNLKPINSDRTLRKNVNYNAHLRWNKGVDLYNIEVYDYLLFYNSDFGNWEFTKQSKYLLNGII